MNTNFTVLCLLIFSIFNPVFGDDHIDSIFFQYLTENYENLDHSLIEQSASGDTKSAIKLSKLMIVSNEESQVYKGEELLRFLAARDIRALFDLGRIYREGVEVFPADESPKRLLKDYEQSVVVFNHFLDLYGNVSNELSQLAFAYIGDGLVNIGRYELAIDHLFGNIEHVDSEPTGLAAYSLAKLYLNGDGISENKKEAMYWFNVAAKKGLGIAQIESNFLKLELEE